MDRIMIIEDDVKLRDQLEIFLSKNGYEVISIQDFTQEIDDLIQMNAKLILLDLNLPDKDGQYLCHEIRKKSNVPIIIITSKNTELDELISMNNGADDFVSKPFNTQILLAKIAAILKRTYQSNQTPNILVCDDFTLDVSKSLVESKGKQIELTKNELKILYFLVNKKGVIVSRDEMMTYLWDSEMFVDDNTLTVNMNRLRKKLEDIDLKDRIETRRGQGYLLK